jgi:hypothetical protein
MPPFDDLSDDQLLDLAQELKVNLTVERTALASVEPRVVAEGRKIRKGRLKMGLNSALAAGGILAAPITMGWSLFVTAGSGGMLAWDMYDLAHDSSEYSELVEELGRLRTQSQTTADRWESVDKEVRARRL